MIVVLKKIGLYQKVFTLATLIVQQEKCLCMRYNNLYL